MDAKLTTGVLQQFPSCLADTAEQQQLMDMAEGVLQENTLSFIMPTSQAITSASSYAVRSK